MKKISFPLSLFLLTLLSFSPCLSAQFLHWDDGNHIVTNPLIYTFSPQTLLQMFAQTINGTYIPLTVLSHNIEYHIFGGSAWVVHLNNVILHAIVAILIYRFALQLGFNSLSAWIASAFFSLHPMHVESVAWATERKDVLYSIFYLLALMQYWQYLQTGKRKPFWYAVGFGLLSILAKPMALSLPWILLLLDFYKGRRFDKSLIKDKIPFALTIFPITAITFFSVAPNPKFMFPESLLIFIWSFAFHLQKFIWPYPLLPLYTPPEPVSLSHPAYAGALLTLIIFIASIIWGRHNRLWVMACLFYVGSTFFLWRFDFTLYNIVADRFMYLPSLGFCLVLGNLLDNWFKQKNKQWVAALALGALLLTLGTLTFLQCRIWQNGLTLWQWTLTHEPHDTTARRNRMFEPYRPLNSISPKPLDPRFLKEPEDVTAYNERGVFFIKNNNLTLALWDFNKAIALNPKNDTSFGNRAGVYQLKGKYKKALADLDKAISLNPKEALHYLNKGIILAKTRRLDDALSLYNKAIALNPRQDEAYYRRGLLFYKKDPSAACESFKMAVTLNKNNPDYFYQQGLCLNFLKKHNDAINAFNNTLRLSPWESKAYNEIGVNYLQSNNPDKALENFNKAIELESYDSKPYNNRAMIYIQQGRYADALDDYNTSIHLDYAPYSSLISRGDLYAASRIPAKAFADYKRAMQINKEDTIATLRYANLAFKLGKNKEALKYIRQVLAKDPLNESAHQGEIAVLNALNLGK